MLGSTFSWDVHIASTTFVHPLSNSHISSNLNGYVMLGISRPFGTIHNRQWTEALEERWWIFVLANYINQSLFARPWSNLSQMKCPSTKCFYQVNCDPMKSRSINPHSSITSRNSCIWAWLLQLPPSFSELFIISLKSPEQSHGSMNLLLSWRSISHDS